jgi:ribosomal protein S18 acetylase RimI-like enzyme
MKLRPLGSDEVALHRWLRLRALLDAPDSFGESYADVEAKSTSYWESLTKAVTEPQRDVLILAAEADTVFGMVYGLRDPERDHAARLGGLWVEPRYRRRGIGRMLVDAVIEWALARGSFRVSLWAPAHSPAALALYRKAGFRETGQRRPLESNPTLAIVAMETVLEKPTRG